MAVALFGQLSCGVAFFPQNGVFRGWPQPLRTPNDGKTQGIVIFNHLKGQKSLIKPQQRSCIGQLCRFWAFWRP